MRRWKATHKERTSFLNALSYRRNKGLALDRINRWREKNAERWNAIQKADSHNRRVMTKYNGQKIETKELLSLLEQSGGRCFYCGCEHNGNFHFDHYVPLAKGGKHELSNLRIACVPCNKHKAAKMPDDFLNVIVLYKSLLIDSKPREGNEAQAGRKAVQRERLSEVTPEMGMQQSELAI